MSSTYLKNINFDFDETEDSCGGHLAYTFAFQGGAASGYNKPLLFKAGQKIEITKSLIEALEKSGEDVSEIKKDYYNQIKNILSDALDEKGFVDKWDWCWITDFSEDTIIFCADDGMYAVGYTINGLVANIEDTATPVMAITDYEVVDGEVLVSEDFISNMVVGVQGMVKSSLKLTKVKKSLVKIKNKEGETTNDSVIAEKNKTEKTSSVNTQKSNEGVPPVENLNLAELFKSAEAQDFINEMISKATKEKDEELSAAQAAVVALQKAESLRVEKNYREVIKSFEFVAEDTVEALVKSFVENPEVAVLMVDVLNKASEAVTKVKEEFSAEKGVDASNKNKSADANTVIAEMAEKIRKNKNK